MANVIQLDFAAYEPRLTPEAREAYERWRKPLDELMHGCRVAGDWVWAGDLSYRVNAVRRLCRKLPQPVSAEHMKIVLDAVSDTVPTVDTEIVSLLA